MKTPGALCWECDLLDCDFVPSELKKNARVLIVGEAPGAEEVKRLAPFVGQSGKLLNGAMRECGYSREDAAYVNVVACRPPGNRTPTPDEIRCCRGRLERDIASIEPNTILAVGKTAREVVHPNATSIRASWGTYYCKLNTTAYPVMSTWHPAYVLRKPGEGTNFIKDIRTAFGGFQTHVTQRAPEVMMPETYEDLAQILSTAPDNSLVAYDLETNQIGWYDKPNKRANSILMMGISWDPGMGVIVSDELLYDDPRTTSLLAEFFRGKKPIGHNIKFDNCFLRHQLDLHVKAYMDTLLAHFVLDENSMHGLKILAQEELGVHDYEHALISQYLSSKNDEYSKVPYEHMAQYCAWDVAVTLSLAEIFEARLYKEGLHDWPFMNLYMPAQDAMTTQQLRGVQVDVGYLEHCQELFGARLEDIRYNAGKMVGKPDINLGSWQQVGAVLWDDLRLPQSHNRKVKERSTSELAVMHLRGKHPFVDVLMKYRRLAKLKSSYIDNMLQYVDVNGRIHPDVLLYGTEMGRISMRDPAVQTIPRPDDPSREGYDPYEDGGVIRGAIIAAPGCMFGANDFSQAELRALAQLSGEQFLRQAYRDGRDIHSEVAVAMFGENFTKEQRVQCKMFNFSYVYGGSEYSFAEDAGLPVAVARGFVQQYNSIMPTALEWKKQQFDKMRKQGYVETIFRQRRRFPLITPDNQDDARKASVHSVVAGSAAGITILAQTKLIEEGVPVVMSVHDSIEFESPEDQVEEDAKHVQEIMIETASKFMPEVPWKVDIEIGSRWAKPPQL